MKQKLLFSLCCLLPAVIWAQSTRFEILPFVNGTTTIKEGQLEAGPFFSWKNVSAGRKLAIQPTLRLPLTDKDNNLLQIDRFTKTWRSIVAFQYARDFTTAASPLITGYILSFQGEYGFSEFKYYPTGKKTDALKEGKHSYAFELKYIRYRNVGAAHGKQISPQFRLRYSYDWEAADKVGVVRPPNGNGLATTTDMVVDRPSATPTLSPAAALQYYPGQGNFSYAPALYYDMSGKNRQSNPFNDLHRLRVEAWAFFYPLAEGNVKIGLSPFLSIRTKGDDDYRTLEYGGLITVKFGTTFLQFL
ncbi:hypothetical protein [Taibaiella helva]|uniref:hypothetical protein n=1 Tax=Taibaiella helva TaxID=2301235 RepID=UPI0013005A1E|nr:hypothetical protein [Taibaiella helva]